jgi:DNA-binding beta-propeller fold protein YncE
MPGTRTIGGGAIRTAALAAILVLAAGTGAASAKDRVYWANRDNNTIAFANLDGSGATKLTIPAGVTIASPSGISLDPAANRIYWTNRAGCPDHAISWMNLDGSAGGNINIAGAVCDLPVASGIDPRTRRIYWTNWANDVPANSKISFAALDGSGGGNLSTSATVDEPFGVAIDPDTGRIYWPNTALDIDPSGASGTIQFANLDGSGGGMVNVGTAHRNDPSGVAVDPTTGLIYWANFNDSTISFANLNGTGGGQLNTNPISPAAPEGVAVDIPGGRIYWANLVRGISFANLNNTGGGDLSTTGVTLSSPVFPAILRVPAGTDAPAASGGNTVGSTLSCTSGSWAGDIHPALLYRAPHSFAFQWTLNGAAVAGATNSTTTADQAGDWRCVVTASNAAGQTSQNSNAVTVFGDSDHDGLLDPSDRCPTTPRGQFDKDNDGCPGPYARLKISAVGNWSVSNRGVQIGTMSVRGLHRGVKVKFLCGACHVKPQTLSAKGSTLNLKKLKRKLLRRGRSFTVTATGFGFIGDRLTVTVKNYGRTHADLVRAARNPFKKKHRCLPVGLSKTAPICSATPPTGP